MLVFLELNGYAGDAMDILANYDPDDDSPA
jgi:hypothetical protein